MARGRGEVMEELMIAIAAGGALTSAVGSLVSWLMTRKARSATAYATKQLLTITLSGGDGEELTLTVPSDDEAVLEKAILDFVKRRTDEQAAEGSASQ